MDHFQYRNGELYAEDVALSRLAAEIGTPFFCYSTATLERHYQVFADAVSGLDASICYAVKANSNVAVIATLARLGAGADVVSGGEMKRALIAGVTPNRIVFSGVGKTREELAEALKAGVTRINVESEPELEILSEVAASLGIAAEISIRINPDVDAKTHEKITTGKSENKFGIDLAVARDVYARAATMPGLEVCGVAVHIGSQLTDLAPYREAYVRTAAFVEGLRQDGHDIRHVDLGGGLGIRYDDEEVPSPAEYGAMVTETVSHLNCPVTFEPGRVIAGNAGVLVSRVLFVKEGLAKNFCIVDAAMNDLIRPTLYNAYHEIVPVIEAPKGHADINMDIVGPICESGDYIAKDRMMAPVDADDLLAVRTAGAYAAVMASTYNTRPLAPEVLVNGNTFEVIRRRFTVDDMIDLETIPDWLSSDPPLRAGGTG
ncbi:MAG: diaminopimelate decarboxylase [Rhodospirillaceae bacterium]|nr:diaminopimelate decarboxylase [Rhodospirillaceae bacterium]MBT5514399.1 diaminopimelate decarboxylase [Rhodospirillaceae bacterium]MBT6086990.1 diaminopimelate decarboxylase [Rhodospirillaceae bacterium]MBT6608232.1 diaminopimelate decarboxylase [Rhodospirillaceae bacterium]MBT6885589.1 diaminopimelate decarboxylase [Rhodospirillaceae bacterium]